jgi:hypothetical protein
MKLIAIALLLLFTVNLHANSDDYRQALVRHTKEVWKLPAKQLGGLILNDMFYAKEIDAAMLTYLGGAPDKVAVRANGIAYWASAEGQRMKGLGFKDWIYNYGSFNKTTRAVTEHGIFSCAEGKWYRDAEHFFTAHGLK